MADLTDGYVALQRAVDQMIFDRMAVEKCGAWRARSPFIIHTTPKEAPMEPNPYYQYRSPIEPFLRYAHHTLVTEPLREKAKTSEQIVRELDVQAGDRIRLTESRPEDSLARPRGRRVAKKDAAVLEGVVLDTKEKDGRFLVRIGGFGHTGGNAGGQHVWFPLADYVVEVLHKAYRWTDEDRAIVAVAALSEVAWERLTEEQRGYSRKLYAPRLERVRQALGVDFDDSSVE